jgi:hypothetical protein
LVVNYSSETAWKSFNGECYRHEVATKWHHVKWFIQFHRDIIEAYDSIWFPDDDLYMHPMDVNLMFDIFEKEQIVLALPSYATNSYFTHLSIGYHRPFFQYREVSFVEIICPLFKKDVLLSVSQHFDEVISGWGLDYLIAEILKDKKKCIIDAVQFVHTRPIGGGNLYQELKINPYDEMNKLQKKYNLTKIMQSYSGKLTCGLKVPGIIVFLLDFFYMKMKMKSVLKRYKAFHYHSLRGR